MKKTTLDPSVRRTTIVTLSQKAGVAPSTVTRALRGDSRISLETRERILALAREFDYTPNILARTLSSGRSGLYGLVLGPSSNPFYTEILHETTRQAEELGVRLLIIHAGSGPIEERTAETLLQYSVDGCIISSAALSSRASEVCEANHVPLVMLNRVALQHGSAVTCDNRSGGEDLARLLLSRGRRRFAVIHTSSPSSTSRERDEAFTAELGRASLQPMLRIDGHSHYDGGFEAGRQIAGLATEKRPDAAFAVSDIMAMGLLDSLRLHSVRVPQDIAVVGFDGLPASGRAIYDLTTIEQPLPQMVQRAFEMLRARSIDRNLPEEILSLRGRLIVRGSSG